MDVTTDGVVNYLYRIPRDHPAGLYWVHPHAHGLALNQVAAGLAMPLTIGRPDYLCGPAGCAAGSAPRLRTLVLKDTQVMPDGRLKLQEEWVFCGRPGPGDSAGQGTCRGVGQRYEGGTWAFTVNGQLHPEIAIEDRAGEVWRILNASANVTYWLAVVDAESKADLPIQVLSVDGVSLEVPAGSTMADLQAKLGTKIRAVRCPTVEGGTPRGGTREPVCADRVLMMPSSRVEIAVVPRSTGSRRAVLRTHGWDTAPAGDRWPGPGAGVDPLAGAHDDRRAGHAGDPWPVAGAGAARRTPREAGQRRHGEPRRRPLQAPAGRTGEADRVRNPERAHPRARLSRGPGEPEAQRRPRD